MKKITQSLFVMLGLIGFNTQVLFAQPSVSATTPPARLTAKVISIFSDAYTNVTGTNFYASWGQATVVSMTQIGTDNILKYANLNYQGTELSGSVNAITMDKLHIDVWSSDGTSFQITPISHGPKEKLVTLTPLNLNTWNSYDINLSDFAGVDFSDIFQFKIVGSGTFYIDNLYFYDSSATVDTEAPTNFTATKGTVTSDAIELILNATDNSGAVNYIITYGTTTLNVGGVSGVQKKYTIGNLQSGTDYSFSVVCKDATGNTATNSPIVITAKTAAGVQAAPAPIHAASNVVSIFSDSFTSAAASANYFPGWGQATVASMVDLSGTNKTIKYTNLNYQGIELNTHVNAGTMQYLHLDAYTENETMLQVTPISDAPVKEFLYTLTPLTLNTWNRYDVPLSAFTGVDKANVFQFKFVGSGGKTVYIDNIYFHNGIVSGVSNPNSDKSITVYPSMTSKYITVKSETEIKQISIYSIIGKNLKTLDVANYDNTIDLDFLSSGNYIVLVKLYDGTTTSHKIVKI